MKDTKLHLTLENDDNSIGFLMGASIWMQVYNLWFGWLVPSHLENIGKMIRPIFDLVVGGPSSSGLM